MEDDTPERECGNIVRADAALLIQFAQGGRGEVAHLACLYPATHPRPQSRMHPFRCRPFEQEIFPAVTEHNNRVEGSPVRLHDGLGFLHSP